MQQCHQDLCQNSWRGAFHTLVFFMGDFLFRTVRITCSQGEWYDIIKWLCWKFYPIFNQRLVWQQKPSNNVLKCKSILILCYCIFVHVMLNLMKSNCRNDIALNMVYLNISRLTFFSTFFRQNWLQRTKHSGHDPRTLWRNNILWCWYQSVGRAMRKQQLQVPGTQLHLSG